MIPRLRELLAEDTAGDPIGSLRWTRRSAAELRRTGMAIRATSVAKHLKRLGYSLRVNRKCLATTNHPDRDRQFQHIAKLRREYPAKGWPIVSVGTKICAANQILVSIEMTGMLSSSHSWRKRWMNSNGSLRSVGESVTCLVRLPVVRRVQRRSEQGPPAVSWRSNASSGGISAGYCFHRLAPAALTSGAADQRLLAEQFAAATGDCRRLDAELGGETAVTAVTVVQGPQPGEEPALLLVPGCSDTVGNRL